MSVGSPYGIVDNMMDCDIMINEMNSSFAITFTFGLIPWGKVWTPIIPPAMDEILSLLSFDKDGFHIKQSSKVDMPLNKETKPNHNLWGHWDAMTIFL